MSYQQVMATKNAYAAAKRSIDDNISPGRAAREANVHRSSVTSALVVYQYGNEDEKKAAEEGRIGVKQLSMDIRKRMTPEQHAAQIARRGLFTHSEETRLEIKNQADIWKHLKPALESLSSMPDAESIVRLVKANSQRESTTNQHIQAARAWLEEFANAWQQYQQSKSGDADSGGGDDTSGVQYPKQAIG